MIRIEWSALKAEAEGTLQADRESREHRRLLDRLLADHQRSLAAAPPSPRRNFGTGKSVSVADLLAEHGT
jgi:hypothetical protein